MTFDDILNAEIEFDATPEEGGGEVALEDVGLSKEELKMVENTILDAEPGEHTLPHVIFDKITLDELKDIVSMRTESKPQYIEQDGKTQLVMRTYFGNFEFVLSGYDAEHTSEEAREIQMYCRFHLYTPTHETINTFNKSLSSSGLYIEDGNLMMQTMIMLTGGVSVINLITQVVMFCNDAETIHSMMATFSPEIQ